MENISFKEFTIKSRPEQFRVAKISPVKLLAISTQVDFDKLQQTENLYQFALENAEVKMGEKWFPVKTKDKEVYMPLGIENDYIALNEIAMFMMTEVIGKAFSKSDESV